MAKQVYWLSDAEWRRIEPLLPRGRKGAHEAAIRKVTKVKGRSWLIVGLIFLLPPTCVGSCVIHDDLLASHFEQIAPGMQRQEVDEILGKPRNIDDCAQTIFKPWKRPDCRDAYLYPSWGMPLIPSMWVVWLNADGMVIDKYRFVSW